MFIFNHQSAIDVLILCKLLHRDFVGISKQEVRSNPIFGPFFALAGTVFIDRSDRTKAIEALKPAVEALREGLSIAIAPEGTRSSTGRLGRFKKGAFHIAMAARRPDRAHRHPQRPRRAAEARHHRAARDGGRGRAPADRDRRLVARHARPRDRRRRAALPRHPPGMVKLIFLCRRRPDITHDAYVARLLAGHVPLALRHHPTMRGYVVNVVEETGAGLEPIDSIGELTFDSLADYAERLYDSPAGRAAIERDVAGFLGRVDAYVTTEHVQLADDRRRATGARTPGVKLFCPVRRRPDLTREAFVAHWFGTHAPIARAHHPGLTRYHTNLVERRLGTDDGAGWDGFTELHFASADSIAGGLFDSPEGERLVREDIAKFLGHAGAYRVAEYVHRIA